MTNNSIKYLQAEEVANRLNISPQYARRLMRENKISSIKIENSYKTTEEHLQDFLENSDVIINPEDRIRLSKKS